MVLEPGDVIVTGTPPGVALGMKPEPKFLKPGDVVTVGVGGDQQAALKALEHQPFVREASIEDDVIRLYVESGEQAMPQILRILDGAGMILQTMSLARPSLDDVFLRQTGRALRDEEAAA